jgi:hypothetical protein
MLRARENRFFLALRGIRSTAEKVSGKGDSGPVPKVILPVEGPFTAFRPEGLPPGIPPRRVSRLDRNRANGILPFFKGKRFAMLNKEKGIFLGSILSFVLALFYFHGRPEAFVRGEITTAEADPAPVVFHVENPTAPPDGPMSQGRPSPFLPCLEASDKRVSQEEAPREKVPSPFPALLVPSFSHKGPKIKERPDFLFAGAARSGQRAIGLLKDRRDGSPIFIQENQEIGGYGLKAVRIGSRSIGFLDERGTWIEVKDSRFKAR